jgi:hypothetical protein
MNIATQIEVYYDDEDHSATASRQINGEYYSCQCVGLAPWGGAIFDQENPFDEDDVEWAAWEELSQAALDEVRSRWNYNGSEWSEPVNDPEVEIVDEPDDDHQIAIVRTAFHGGGVIGYVDSEESADEWIQFKLQGTGCTCGCYCVVEASEVESLPDHTEASPDEPAN